MSPPDWKPSYWEAIYGRESPYPDTPQLLIDDMVDIARRYVDWFVDDLLIPVELSVTAPGRIGFTANAVTGEIALDVEDGWVRAIATIGGTEVFRGYIECRWEEYEVWPADAADHDAEEPGRLGKHLMWASLRSAAWPGIAPLASDGGWVNIQQDEKRWRERKDRDERKT